MYCIKIADHRYYSKRTVSSETRNFDSSSRFDTANNAVEIAKALIVAKGYPILFIRQIFMNNVSIPAGIVIDTTINKAILNREVRIYPI